MGPVVCYSWTALSGTMSDAVVALGITTDHAKARRDAEEYLRNGRAFVVIVDAVRTVLAVHSLSACYVQSGVAWLGRRDICGDVVWRRYALPGHRGPDGFSLD